MFGAPMTVLLGKKIGMSRLFTEAGRIVPVTAIEATPCFITQIKTVQKDGYVAVQIGYGTKRHPNKPQVGHTKALETTPQVLREFRSEDTGDLKVGDIFDVTSLKAGDLLRISATSKGKGFSGVIKRHNFHRGPETHGSDHHRAPGSIGSMFPQHVLRGQKMPGKMGNDRVTIRKVEVVDIDVKNNVVFVKGPVPGSRGNLVELSVI